MDINDSVPIGVPSVTKSWLVVQKSRRLPIGDMLTGFKAMLDTWFSSATFTVPFWVPSLLHKSKSQLKLSEAINKMRFPTFTILPIPALPLGLISFTRQVPCCVPSVHQSSSML